MVKQLKDINVLNKTVFVRVDFNVPLKDGVIKDDNRIVEALPTIKYLLEHKAKIVLLSHLGKVDHKDPLNTDKDKKKNNLEPVAKRLGELLNLNVKFLPENIGETVVKTVKGLKSGDVLLLQNTRYQKGEEKNDPELSDFWAELADAFVMDAFGSAHRAHASTYGLPEDLNRTGRDTAIGFLVEKEVASLSKCIEAKEHPYIAILGGAKVSDKIKVIEKLLEKADKIIIGGAMSYTFLKANGINIGTSRVEESQLDFAKTCYKSGKIVLPVDHVIASDFNDPVDIKVTNDQSIPDNFMGLDIGPKSIALFKDIIKSGKIIFWNGPMGVFENPKFEKGTKEILLAMSQNKKAFTVIGGGDTAAASKLLGFSNTDFSHISTGGGASLEMIENNGSLPGIEIIGKK